MVCVSLIGCHHLVCNGCKAPSGTPVGVFGTYGLRVSQEQHATISLASPAYAQCLKSHKNHQLLWAGSVHFAVTLLSNELCHFGGFHDGFQGKQSAFCLLAIEPVTQPTTRCIRDPPLLPYPSLPCLSRISWIHGHYIPLPYDIRP